MCFNDFSCFVGHKAGVCTPFKNNRYWSLLSSDTTGLTLVFFIWTIDKNWPHRREDVFCFENSIKLLQLIKFYIMVTLTRLQYPPRSPAGDIYGSSWHKGVRHHTGITSSYIVDQAPWFLTRYIFRINSVPAVRFKL